MSIDIPKKIVTDLINEVMHIQKRYAHEQLGARNDRRNEVKKLINRLVSETESKSAN